MQDRIKELVSEALRKTIEQTGEKPIILPRDFEWHAAFELNLAQLVAEDCANVAQAHKWWEDAPELHRGPDEQNTSIAEAIRARYGLGE